jgi:sugar/nucleoside kinase (ribokinase family)
VTEVVDTTGAGDLFAAGFLHGLSQGKPALECAILGGVCSAEIISHFGARPECSLKERVLQRSAKSAAARKWPTQIRQTRGIWRF